jgi:hypothetical protein
MIITFMQLLVNSACELVWSLADDRLAGNQALMRRLGRIQITLMKNVSHVSTGQRCTTAADFDTTDEALVRTTSTTIPAMEISIHTCIQSLHLH